MIVEKKFAIEGMDGDTNPRLLSQGSALNLMNCRIGTSKYGRDLRWENIAGTTLISQHVLPPYGTHQTIGSCIDVNRGRVIYFNYNSSNDHGIYAYEISTGITYAVLYDSQVDGGLNFSKNNRIDRNCKIVGDYLYWTDGINEPRKINVEAAIKANLSSYSTDTQAYSLPLSFDEITVIKHPPQLAPNIQKGYDSGFSGNFIANESYEFAFQYVWYDNETSVVGTYSPSSRLNKVSDTYNKITVTMDSAQTIPNSVKMVNLIVRYSNSNNAFIAKVWDKTVQSERNEIIEQNNGTQVLTYDFYGNIAGETIATDYVLKPFDSVPIFCKTLEVAKDRLFMANNTEGYDAPTTTSLTTSIITNAIAGITGLSTNLISIQHSGISDSIIVLSYTYSYAGWFVYLNSSQAQPAGYYELTATATTNGPTHWPAVAPTATLPPPPSVFAISGLTWKGTTITQAIANTTPAEPEGRNWRGSNTVSSTTNIVNITGITVSAYDVFKTSAQYKAGVVFYDYAMRKCGVVTSDNSVFEIPARNYSFTTGVTGVSWNLSNANALNEIPDWAYYYCVVRTLNQKTRFFVQSFTDAAKYATKNNTTGEYDFTSNLFVTGCVALCVNSTAMFQNGVGYVYSEGDVCILTRDDGTTYTLSVTGQVGSYILLNPQDIGDLSARRFIFEIYTPYQTSQQEPFYEVGQMYRVLNPTTASRSYEITTDIFPPDSYVLTRNYNSTTYYAEGMSPNDRFWKNWYDDTGKVNLITKLGQVVNETGISYSNTIIEGTAINGLSTFEALNKTFLPVSCGQIQKLQVTSKVQDELGIVMLGICEKQTASMYLGETQQYGSNQQTTLTLSTEVIGTINVLKGDFGTINPESVIEFRGNVYWYDVNNGVFIQYSANGLLPVSYYKQNRFFQRYAIGYLSASTNNLDNINGFHHIPTFIDPFHKEIGVTLPALIYQNYASTLPSYSSVPSYATSIVDRFDIFDQLGKTMAFKYEDNKWGQNYEFLAEWYDYAQNQLFGFKNGLLYLHDSDTTHWNRFYGVDYPVRICLTANANPSLLKILNTISVESNTIPNYVVAMANYPNTQITDLASTDSQWVNQQGIFYGSFLKDRLSPNVSGTADQKLYTGDDITDVAIYVMLEWQAYNSLFYCNFVNINYSPSMGQKQIANPQNT